MRYDYDLIVIGSGAGGSGAALAAARMGKKVAVVEREVLGGECPNFGCVPTKALLHAAEVFDTVQNAENYGIKVRDVIVDDRAVQKWKKLVLSRTGAARATSVYDKANVTVLHGDARFLNPREIKLGNRKFSARFFLIATGSNVFIPPIHGLDSAGYITFKEAIDFTNMPDSIFIIGGGAIGCEFAQVFSAFGTKVYLADATPRLLVREDPEVGEIVGEVFKSRHIDVILNATVKNVVKRGEKRVVFYETNGKEHQVTVEEVFVATGKRANTEGLGLEQIGVAVGKHGIKVNKQLRTSVKHIYAAGDVVGPYLYTATAHYQSDIAAHNMFHRKQVQVDYQVVPRCVFTSPEVASVGISETEARERGIPVRVGMVPITSVGRANTADTREGFVKVITDDIGYIMGAAIVAPRAGELIHQIALGIKLHAHVDDIIDMIHAYPTYSEAIKVACSSVE